MIVGHIVCGVIGWNARATSREGPGSGVIPRLGAWRG